MSKQVNQKTKTSNKVLLPIILLMGFIPLIVHTYSYNSNLSQFNWFPNGADSQTDFFFGWKMIAIIVVGIVMAGILLYQYFKKKQGLRFENSFYFLFFYAMFVAMSALFSNYKYWVARGTYELFEPVWVVFVYILLCYYTYHFVQEEKQVKFILCGAGIGMTVVTLIGVFQYFRMDFFKTGLGKHLITNPSWWNDLDNLNFNMTEGTSYTTLYNPNFLSFYFGMLIPLLVCLFIAAKKAWQRVLIVVAEVLCLICLKGSGSDTGWMALIVGAVILTFVLLSRKKKAFCVALAIVLIGGVAAITVGSKTEAGTRIKNTIVGTYRIDDRYAVRDIDTGDDSVMLNVRGNKMYVSYTTDANGVIVPACTDENGQTIELTMTDVANQVYVINDERFAEGAIQSILLGNENIPAIAVGFDGIAWDFVKTQEAGYCYLNKAGKLVKWEQIKNAKLLNEDAMSYRGHMWNMTIPLLGKHVLIGSGANTYMFEYPQDDYLGQAYVYGYNSYEVKAHCWYLQQWVESGLIGTLALLIFIVWYAVQSIRIYRRVDLHESLSWIGFGLFAAVLVYLIAGVANDSNVCTAPVFWGMLGLGLATNRMIAEKEGLFVKETVAEETTVKQPTETKASGVHAETDNNAQAASNTQSSNKKQTANKKQSRKQRKNQKK